MNNMKKCKLPALCLFISLLPHALFAQDTRVIVSARLTANSSGAAISVFTDRKAAVEGIYASSNDYFQQVFTCLYTEHYQFFNVEGLKWFMGAGLHAGYYKLVKPGSAPKPAFITYEKAKTKILFAGSDAIFGMTYKFRRIPFLIGIDIKPYVNFINEESQLWDGAARIGVSF
jgi:hypothetical protein